jgi:hypothetical protein
MDLDDCHLACLLSMGDGYAKVPKQSWLVRLKGFIRRLLGPRNSKKLSSLRDNFRLWHDNKTITHIQTETLKAGDHVRVRSKAEIESTLDDNHKLQGCLFMHEQQPYCGTEQRVLKIMERFVDERDLAVKKCNGLVLLEGVMCQGTRTWGRCDRSCLMFWREEWLEKIKY